RGAVDRRDPGPVRRGARPRAEARGAAHPAARERYVRPREVRGPRAQADPRADRAEGEGRGDRGPARDETGREGRGPHGGAAGERGREARPGRDGGQRRRETRRVLTTEARCCARPDAGPQGGVRLRGPPWAPAGFPAEGRRPRRRALPGSRGSVPRTEGPGAARARWVGGGRG